MDEKEELIRMQDEIREVLRQLDELAELWGDEGKFRRCRDRLRNLVDEAEHDDDDRR